MWEKLQIGQSNLCEKTTIRTNLCEKTNKQTSKQTNKKLQVDQISLNYKSNKFM